MVESHDAKPPSQRIATPPGRLVMLFSIGPAIVWCAEYIGSGEVILATRSGAILGCSVMWAVVLGICLKYVIGLAGGWYTVTTGESMIDMLGRMPGPKNAVVWFVLVAQLLASVFAIGSLAASAGAFLAELAPIDSHLAGWMVTLLAVGVAWVGEFKPLKFLMSALVGVTLLGIAVTFLRVVPPAGELLSGLIPTSPVTPEWAIEAGVSHNAWAEVLPLLGWGAGGFASQVWYTYWIMGAGYGASAGKRQGLAADVDALKNLGEEDIERLQGWRKIVTFDATTALVVGVGATLGFLIVGAQILGARQLAPEGADVALTLATVFGAEWGSAGATLFLVGGAAALISTQLAQVAGWPYLLDDATRICIPAIENQWTPLVRRRAWLVFFLATSMTVVYTMGYKPVELVRFAAIAEGLVLTPIQAAALIIGLYWVMPRMFQPEAGKQLRPSPVIGAGLVLCFLFFAYFCVAQLPAVLFPDS